MMGAPHAGATHDARSAPVMRQAGVWLLAILAH